MKTYITTSGVEVQVNGQSEAKAEELGWKKKRASRKPKAVKEDGNSGSSD